MTTELHPKYNDWLESYNFDNCKLNRGEYAQFLINYITNEHDGFVLNLDGSWGSGKTEFLKRFYTTLIYNNYPAIYIDAWKSDFSKEPLTVVSCELLDQIEHLNSNLISNEKLDQLKVFFKKSFKAIITSLAAYTSNNLLGDSSSGVEFVNKILENDDPQYINSLKENYNEQIEAIENIRGQLSYLAEDLQNNYNINIPVIVLIDELDRCRPSYAIEMLEVIKHFFSTKHFVFIIATDTEQLAHSINAIYGANFNSSQYLKRFFDRKAKLPEPDVLNYIKTKTIEIEVDKRIVDYYLIDNAAFDIYEQITLAIKSYDLHLRDIDQLTNKINACLRHIKQTAISSKKTQIVNIAALIVGLIEFDKNDSNYKNRTNINNAQVQCARQVKFKDCTDLSFEEFANLALKSTTLKTVHEGHRTRTILHSYDDFNRRYEGDSYIRRNAHSQISSKLTQIDDIETTSYKFWLWNNYKNLIELAGTID